MEEENKKYYIEKIGLELNTYCIKDGEDYQKFGIKDEDILEKKDYLKTLSKERKKCLNITYDGIDGLGHEITAESRVDNSVRHLEIDDDIEKVLKRLSRLTVEQRYKISQKYGVGDYAICTICENVRQYVKDKNISTVTVSSVKLFAKALQNIVDVRNVLHILKREGIYIYFKEDGLWTGNDIQCIDIGALAALAIYT